MTPTSIGAGGGPCSSRSRSRRGGSRREQIDRAPSSSSSVHQRTSWTCSAARSMRRRRVELVDAHEVDSARAAGRCGLARRTCASRAQISGPSSKSTSPASSASSRRNVCSALTCVDPAARRRTTTGRSPARKSTSSTRSRSVEHERPHGRRARPARASRAARGTSAAARRTERRRSPARSTGARRGARRRAAAPAGRAPAARRTCRGRPPCRRSASARGRSSARSARGAPPRPRSRRRRSPEPGVVR